MKFQFNPEQCHWLNHYINALIGVSAKRAETQAVNRAAHKMRYKFHGTPLWVNLSVNERALLADLVMYRFETLATTAGDERTLVRSILEVLAARAKEVSNETNQANS